MGNRIVVQRMVSRALSRERASPEPVVRLESKNQLLRSTARPRILSQSPERARNPERKPIDAPPVSSKKLKAHDDIDRTSPVSNMDRGVRDMRSISGELVSRKKAKKSQRFHYTVSEDCSKNDFKCQRARFRALLSSDRRWLIKRYSN